MDAVEALLDTTKTPFFVLDLSAIDRAVSDIREVLGSELFYMLKCNSHPEVVTRLARNGVGFAVSHESELRIVSEHAPHSPVSCVGSSTDEKLLRAAAEFDLRYVSLSTQQSFKAWTGSGIDAVGLVRRAHGSGKFGVREQSFRHEKIAGVHIHTGTAVAPDIWAGIVSEVHESSELPIVDAGGGFRGPLSLATDGLSIRDYVSELRDDCRSAVTILEPGRYLVESAMVCVTRVVDVDGDRAYLDVGSNLLPPLASARYMTAGRIGDDGKAGRTYRLFDSGCMDVHYLPDLESAVLRRGDVVVIGNCGAYTYSLWSSFGGDRASVIPVAAVRNATV